MRKTKEANALYQRELRAKRKSLGLCNMCSEPSVVGKTRCGKHLAYFQNRRKLHPRSKEENFKVQEKRKQLVACGLCTWCKQSKGNSTGSVCVECRSRECESTKTRHQHRLNYGLCKWCGKNAVTGDNSQICIDCHCKRVARNTLKSVDRWTELRDKYHIQSICPYTGILLLLGVNASLDHLVAKSAGGSDEINNLQWVYGSTDFDVNIMKGSSSEVNFLRAVSLIYLHKDKSCRPPLS